MSTLTDLLILNLGARLTKLLIESWIGKGTETTVIDEAIDILTGRIQSKADQKKAARDFEEIGDRMARQLLPLFESAELAGHINPKAVVLALETTLGKLTNSRFIVDKNLEAGTIIAELKKKPPPTGNSLFTN